MARIVLVKVLSGLTLGVRQLAGELRRSGHDAKLIFFKTYAVGPARLESQYEVPEHTSYVTGPGGEIWNWNMYLPVTERERELLAQEIESFGADAVGFSLPTTCMSLAADLSAHLRARLGLPIIWGGPGPTLEPERAMRHADVVCINEGEEVIVELAERIDASAPLVDVHGTWARLPDGTTRKNPRRPLLDLETIAIPERDSGRMVLIVDDEVRRNYSLFEFFRQYDMMTQRGCPFSCSFCIESKYQEMFGRKGSLRRRSVDIVLEELRAAKEELKVTGVMFWDDVFSVDRRWLRNFAPRYKAEIGLPFWCYTYPTTTRRDDVALLRDAGCRSMTMGIQTGSQRVLNEYFNRPTPLDKTIEAARIVLEEGVVLYFDLLSRVPYETEQDLKDTFEFLLRLPRGSKLLGMAHMRSYPGYAYTEGVAASHQEFQVDEETYLFYERMFFVAVADMSEADKRAIMKDPRYREDPERLVEFMPRRLVLNYLANEELSAGTKKAPRQAELGLGQGELAEELPSEPSELEGVRRRLPVLA